MKPLAALQAGEAVRLTVDFQSDRIRVYVNGGSVPAIDVKDSAFREGYISLNVSQADVRFDNISISSYSRQEPIETSPQTDVGYLDSFQDSALQNWQTTGAVVLEDGALRLGAEGVLDAAAGLKGRIFGTASIEFDMRIADDGGDATNWGGIQFGKGAPHGTVDNVGGYLLYFRKNGDIDLLHGGSVLATGHVGGEIDLGEFVHIRVLRDAEAGTVSVFLNGSDTPVLEAEAPGKTSKAFLLSPPMPHTSCLTICAS